MGYNAVSGKAPPEPPSATQKRGITFLTMEGHPHFVAVRMKMVILNCA
jgi:hypothetical protein